MPTKLTGLHSYDYHRSSVSLQVGHNGNHERALLPIEYLQDFWGLDGFDDQAAYVIYQENQEEIDHIISKVLKRIDWRNEFVLTSELMTHFHD